MPLLWLPLLAASIFPAPHQDADNTRLTALLRKKDQALLDAIAPGDHKVWEDLVADGFLYVDENNKILDRDAFLKELTPMPKGVTGFLVMRTYKVNRIGDTAIVVHYDDETEHFYGTKVHAEYLTTETWQLIDGEWKLRLEHCVAVPADPAAITLTDAEMDDLAGTYRAGDLTITLRREGHRLNAIRVGKPDTELKAETRDVLFTAGQPRSRKVFLRNAKGDVTGFAERREGRDLLWKRVP